MSGTAQRTELPDDAAAATNAANAVEISTEQRAREMGWKPQEEFSGAPSQWRSAEEFVARAESDLPLLRKRNRVLENQVREIPIIKQQLEQATNVVVDISERMRTTEERSYARARAELLAERDRAIEAGDKQTVHAVDAQVADLDKHKPKPAPEYKPVPAAPVLPPEVQDWVARNDWFEKDSEMAAAAIQMAKGMMEAKPGQNYVDVLARTERAMKAAYPDRFPAPARAVSEDDNAKRAAPAPVSGSSPARGPQGSKAGTFEAMPQASKDNYARYNEMMVSAGKKPLDKAVWARDYWEQFQET